MSATGQDMFRRALALHQASEIDRAAALYRSILTDTPDHPGANHLLGVALNQQGDPHAALPYLEKALSLCDTKAVYWNNYGAVLRDLGRLDEAKAAFEKALSIKPDYPDALSNLGLVLCERLELDEAERYLRQALRLDSRHADALAYLGDVLRQRGEMDGSTLPEQPNSAFLSHCDVEQAWEPPGSLEKVGRGCDYPGTGLRGVRRRCRNAPHT